ncbi:MAG: hypothetical protein Kow0098_15200 [Ignavibacteriaceae bacterium]
MKMKKEIKSYNNQRTTSVKEICDLLAQIIQNELPEAESKIWHAHLVWFLNNYPTFGYNKQKNVIRWNRCQAINK